MEVAVQLSPGLSLLLPVQAERIFSLVRAAMQLVPAISPALPVQAVKVFT
jgi:hypothetical protein